MNMNVHLNFQGNCAEAFDFYKKVFGATNDFTMKYGEAPHGMPVPPDWKDKVMHTSIPLGDGRLMGCDAPPGRSTPIGGFQISVEAKDEAEVKRIYEALKGAVMDLRARLTLCFEKAAGKWLVVTEHASVPFDMQNFQPLISLKE